MAMSIVFKPTIRGSYENLITPPTKTMLERKPKKDYNSWSASEFTCLIALRAMNTSYNDIGALLGRSPATCGWMVHDKQLNLDINQLRKKLTGEIMNNFHGNYND
tara:strand:+ start:903 stop:1217 length:315 start_codon:yes stop_codon:yes gene_type:complete